MRPCGRLLAILVCIIVPGTQRPGANGDGSGRLLYETTRAGSTRGHGLGEGGTDFALNVRVVSGGDYSSLRTSPSARREDPATSLTFFQLLAYLDSLESRAEYHRQKEAILQYFRGGLYTEGRVERHIDLARLLKEWEPCSRDPAFRLAICRIAIDSSTSPTHAALWTRIAIMICAEDYPFDGSALSEKYYRLGLAQTLEDTARFDMTMELVSLLKSQKRSDEIPSLLEDGSAHHPSAFGGRDTLKIRRSSGVGKKQHIGWPEAGHHDAPSTYGRTTAPSDSALSVDHIVHRLASNRDTGTTLLFLSNETEVATTITGVVLNDVGLSTRTLLQGLTAENETPDQTRDLRGWMSSGPDLDERLMWYSVLPNPVPPKGTSALRMKWAFQTRRLIKIVVKTAAGREIHRALKPENPALEVLRIGFDEDLSGVYVHLKRNGIVSPKRARLWLDGSEIAAQAVFASETATSPPEAFWTVGGETTDCVWARFKRPRKEGQPILVKVEIEADRKYVTAEVVRALTHFSVTVDNGKVVQDLTPWSGKSEASARLTQILICPTHRHRSYRGAAAKILSRKEDLYRQEPHTICVTHVCKDHQEEGGSVFGPLNDLVITNVAEGAVEATKGVRGGWEHPSQRLASVFSAAMAPRPWIALVDLDKDERLPLFSHRRPSPDEVRMLIYYAISRGAGGVHYRSVPGEDEAPVLLAAVRKINRELEAIGPLLCMGCPANLGSTDDEKVEAATILCGPEAIVLMLINHDWEVPQLLDEYLPTRYHPRKNVRMTLRLPSRLKLKRIEPVGSAPEVGTPVVEGDRVSFSVPEVRTCNVYRVLLSEVAVE